MQTMALIFTAKNNYMKVQILISFVCAALIFFCGCSNDKNRNAGDLPPIEKKNLAIIEKKENFDDSLKKYKVEAFNDTCIKYLYGINGFKVITDSDSVLVGMCKYKPWRIGKVNDTTTFIFYYLNYRDSIPMSSRFGNEMNFHSFDIDTKHKKIKKVFFGQGTSYMKFNDFVETYNKAISSRNFKTNLIKYYPKLHPDFKKYFFIDSLKSK